MRGLREIGRLWTREKLTKFWNVRAGGYGHG